MDVTRKRFRRKRKTDGNSNDEELQQHLLERLNAYGERLLGEDGEHSKQATRLTAGEEMKQITVNNERTAMNRQDGEKVNSRKTDVTFVGKVEDISAKKVKRKKKWEEKLEEELRSFNRDPEIESKGKGGEKKKKKKEKREAVVIVFEDRAKRKKVSEDNSASSDKSAMISTREHMREIAQEVYHLGLSGFDFEDKEKLEMQRAVKLGAKPPKNQYVPYKEFMEQQKQKKEEELKQREIDRKMGLQVKKKSNDQDDRKSFLLRKKGFWQDPSNNRRFKVDGQLGRYKNGVQVLSKRDVFNTLKGKGGNSRGRKSRNKRKR